MSDSILRDKSKEFAKSIVFLCRELKSRKIESVLTNQLLRCGTSVGANIFEGKYAQGCKDLISKFEIALKEINECEYWLELIHETGGISIEEINKLKSDCISIRRMLVASVKTIKSKEQK